MVGIVGKAAAVLLLAMGLAGCSSSPTVLPPPPATAPAPPPVAPNGDDPRAIAFLHLAESMQGSRGNLPGGCATLAGERVCVPRVTVDGQKLTDLAVLQGIVTAAASPNGPRLPLRSSRAMRSGVADAVFQRLLHLEAIRDGINVANAQARAFARHELQLFEQHPAQARGQGVAIPAGMTARQYFLSPRTVAGYRDGMVVARERDRILRPHPSMPRALVFREWFRARLHRHRVTINGSAPGFALADVLPDNP